MDQIRFSWLKRLRAHGLVKRVSRAYRYCLTQLGRRVASTVLKLREFVIISTLAQPLSM